RAPEGARAHAFAGQRFEPAQRFAEEGVGQVDAGDRIALRPGPVATEEAAPRAPRQVAEARVVVLERVEHQRGGAVDQWILREGRHGASVARWRPARTLPGRGGGNGGARGGPRAPVGRTRAAVRGA